MPRTRKIEIGARLRDSRLAARLTPADVAQEMKLSPKTIYAWEAGSREVGSMRLADLCLMYGVSADFILFGTHMVPSDLRDMYSRLGRDPSP